MRGPERSGLVPIVIAVSAAFAWILWPYFAAVLWAVVGAIVFTPLNRRLTRRFGGRSSLSAIITVMIVVVLVIVPLAVLALALAREASSLVSQIQTGALDLGAMPQDVLNKLPAWARDLLDKLGISDLSDAREKLSAVALRGTQFIATQALNIGQNTFNFLIGLLMMLYLLFFLLRDGDALAQRIRGAAPLPSDTQTALINKFIIVIRAMIKGSVLVAIIQGVLGGFIFWLLGLNAPLLWGVVTTFMSLLPSIGPGLIWLPFALYLLAAGSIWEGVALIAFGFLVIGLVDNLLRPILVGKDTKLPDYVVLISTLGGLEVLGLNGLILGPVIAAMFIAVWGSFSAQRSNSL